jgi:hypothetical protein
MNNVATVGNLANATGVISGDPQAVNATIGINSTAVGAANLAQGLRSTAVGFKNQCTAAAIDSNAFGNSNYVTGTVALAVGNSHTVSGYLGMAVGFGCTASGTASAAIGRVSVASALYTIAAGYRNTAAAIRSTAVGYRNTCTAGSTNSVAMGRSNFSSATSLSSVALGVLNNSATPSNLNIATGAIAGDPQAANATIGINSTAVGVANNASALRSVAIGFNAQSRIQDCLVAHGPQIAIKDSGEGTTAALKFLYFNGTENYLLSEEIDFLALAADYEIAIPAGIHVWLNEVDVICTAQTGGAVTLQPTVRAGITGTPAKYLAAILTTNLTTSFKRNRYATLAADDGESSGANLSVGVTVPGTLAAAGTYKGRFAIKCVKVEDE